MLKFKFQILKLNSPVFEKCKNLLKLKWNLQLPVEVDSICLLLANVLLKTLLILLIITLPCWLPPLFWGQLEFYRMPMMPNEFDVAAVPAVPCQTRAGCVCALEPPGLPACPTQHYRLPVLGGWRAAGDDKQGAGAVHGDLQVSAAAQLPYCFFLFHSFIFVIM